MSRSRRRPVLQAHLPLRGRSTASDVDEVHDIETDHHTGEESETPMLDEAGGGFASADPCNTWDDDCEPEVPLSEIVGDDVVQRVDAVLTAVSGKCLRAIATFTAAQEQGMDVRNYVDIAQGIWARAGLLEDSANELQLLAASSAGEGSVGDANLALLISRLEEVERGDALMNKILALTERGELEAFAKLVSLWATIGADPLRVLVLQAEAGRQALHAVVSDFRAHQQDFERHLQHAKLDTANLLLGPLAALEGIPDAVSRVQVYSNAVIAASGEPGTPWERARQLRSVAWAPAKDLMANLAKANPWKLALAQVNVLLGTCQTIVDLGLASTDLALIHQSIGQLHEVNRLYGLAFSASETAEHMLTFLLPLMETGERMEGLFEALDTVVRDGGAEFL